MRVLFLTYPRIGLNRGGMQIQIEETSKGLAELGVEVIPYDPWQNQIPNVNICHVFSIDGSMVYHVQRAVGMGKPVVISSVLNLFQSQPLLTRMKVELSRFIPGMYSDLKRASLMMRVASRVIALNDDEHKLLHKVFDLSSERIVTIPNGVNQRFGDGDPSLFVQKYGLRDFVLNVASIEKKKKPAVANICHEGPAIPLGHHREGLLRTGKLYELLPQGSWWQCAFYGRIGS